MKLVQKAYASLLFAAATYATIGCDIPPGWKSKCGSSTDMCPAMDVPKGTNMTPQACCESPTYSSWLSVSNFPDAQCPSYGSATGLMCTFVNPMLAPAGHEVSVCGTLVPAGWVVTNTSAGTCLNNANQLTPKQTLLKLTGLPVGKVITSCSSGVGIIPAGWTHVSSTSSSPACPALYGSHVYRRDF